MNFRGLALLVVAIALFAGESSAAEPARKSSRRVRMQYPPRYTRDSMSQLYVYKNRQGQVKTRVTYPGYAEGFPPPAYLYYGYPKSGDYTGMGIDGTP
jgi:hypothetical protein